MSDLKIKSVTDLNQLYTHADGAHSSLFSEQRSNVLLVAGNHYAKRGNAFWRNIRNSAHVSSNQKMRLVKNHIQKITKTYVNNIIHHNPGVEVIPKNPSEFHDQKVAELHQSVLLDMQDRKNFDRQKFLAAKDFVEIGEAWMKVFYDPTAGEFVGYEPKKDKDGEFVVADGVPQADTVFTGDVVWERMLGFNVLTDPSARSWEETRYVILRKMVPTKNLKHQFKGDDRKLKHIIESSHQTFMLFDAQQGSYKGESRGLTMVREYYFKPSAEYPNGYYWISTENGILFEGELPQGIFPIIYTGFDEASTSARSFSIIKQCRPYQAEINRSASKIAEHQVTLGDDKLVLQAGATLSAGATAHGIKSIKTSGPVTHLPGRTGDQYVSYMEGQIQEMYFVANVEEDSTDKPSGELDPYSLLFRSMKDKKRFSMYSEKFERFLKDWASLSLRYAKKNYTKDMIVQIIDKKEQVNIKEFKSSDDLSTEIAITKQSEDIETKLGKQLSLNHLLQFAGGNLGPGDVGQVVRNMPFVNNEEIFSDLTIDYDNMRSDILAMDRGEFVSPNQFDNHQYVIKKLIHRMKMKDFGFLSFPVQQAYQVKLQQHEQSFATQQQEAAQLSSGFVPSGGFLVKADVRIPNPTDPTKTQLVKIPIEALSWLIQTLEKQGTTQAMLQGLEPSAQADIGRNVAAVPESQGLAGAPLQNI